MKATTPVLELLGNRVVQGRKLLGNLVPAPTAFDIVVRFPPCPICGQQVPLVDLLLHRFTCRKVGEGQLRCRMSGWVLPPEPKHKVTLEDFEICIGGVK